MHKRLNTNFVYLFVLFELIEALAPTWCTLLAGAVFYPLLYLSLIVKVFNLKGK